jgi:putative transposase
MRLVHFSVQSDHVHMIIEASDGLSLSRGLQRFESRVAMEINRIAGRSGKLWRERYHRRDLTSPSQVRNALVYVLMNIRKHDGGNAILIGHHLGTLDPCSSARWFTDWHPAACPPRIEGQRARPPSSGRAEDALDESPPIVPAQTWLANKGWKPRGLLRFDEVPRSPG